MKKRLNISMPVKLTLNGCSNDSIIPQFQQVIETALVDFKNSFDFSRVKALKRNISFSAPITITVKCIASTETVQEIEQKLQAALEDIASKLTNIIDEHSDPTTDIVTSAPNIDEDKFAYLSNLQKNERLLQLVNSGDEEEREKVESSDDSTPIWRDIASIIPVVGTLLDLAEGNYESATLSLATDLFPVGKIGKIGLVGGRVISKIGKGQGKKVLTKGIEKVAIRKNNNIAGRPRVVRRVKGAGKLTGTLDGLTQAERTMVDDLLKQGKNIEIVPRSNVQGVQTHDFKINGVSTELKTLTGTSLNTPVTRIQEAFKQGKNALLDARGNPNITAAEVETIFKRIEGIYKGRIPGEIEIWANNGIFRR